MERPFGWIPFRIIQNGLLAQLSRPAKLLYLVLCVVADREGLSFWGDGRLSQLLELSTSELDEARVELWKRDLMAFDGRLYQVLSLPEELPTEEPMRWVPRMTAPTRTPVHCKPIQEPTRGVRGPEQLKDILRRVLPGACDAD